MTLPRIVVPGCYMVQRRVVHRRFFLKPTPELSEIFLYCLAHAAASTGIRLHEFMVMSNHYHVVLSDPCCGLPKFEQILNSFVARNVNASYRQRGTFWENESYAAPALAEEGDILDKCVYALANPCAAHLVEHAREWPGASSWKMAYGEPVLVRRPDFFGKDMPEILELTIVRPPVMPELDDVNLRNRIRERVMQREQQLIAERKTQGRPVLGVRRVLAQRHDDAPRTPAKVGDPAPRTASRSIWAVIERLGRDATWIEAYREALREFCAGVRDAVFPHGTYLMRLRFGVACASP